MELDPLRQRVEADTTAFHASMEQVKRDLVTAGDTATKSGQQITDAMRKVSAADIKPVDLEVNVNEQALRGQVQAFAQGLSEGIDQELSAVSDKIKDTLAGSLTAATTAAQRAAKDIDAALSGIGAGLDESAIVGLGEALDAAGPEATQAAAQIEQALGNVGPAATQTSNVVGEAGREIKITMAEAAASTEDAEARFAAAQRRWQQAAAGMASGTAIPDFGARLRADLEGVDDAVNQAAGAVDKGGRQIVGQIGGWGTTTSHTSRQMAFALQNVGFQVQDFVIQVSNGTNVLRAFAMQAPQAFAFIPGIGAAGSLVVSLVATVVSLGAAFFAAREKAQQATDTFADLLKALQAIGSGEDEVNKVTQAIANMNEEARTGARLKLEITAEDLQEKLDAARDRVLDTAREIQGALRAASRERAPVPTEAPGTVLGGATQIIPVLDRLRDLRERINENRASLAETTGELAVFRAAALRAFPEVADEAERVAAAVADLQAQAAKASPDQAADLRRQMAAQIEQLVRDVEQRAHIRVAVELTPVGNVTPILDPKLVQDVEDATSAFAEGKGTAFELAEAMRQLSANAKGVGLDQVARDAYTVAEAYSTLQDKIDAVDVGIAADRLRATLRGAAEAPATALTPEQLTLRFQAQLDFTDSLDALRRRAQQAPPINFRVQMEVEGLQEQTRLIEQYRGRQDLISSIIRQQADNTRLVTAAEREALDVALQRLTIAQQSVALATEERHLQAQVATGGRSLTAAQRAEVRIADIAAERGGTAALAAAPRIRRIEGERDVVASQEFVRSQRDQAEQIQLQLRYAGQQSQEYRTQLALLQARQRLQRELTPAESRAVAATAAEAGALADQQFLQTQQDQAQQLSLQLQYVGQQNEKYQTQLALLQARQRLQRDLTPGEARAVTAVAVGTGELERQNQIQGAREQVVAARMPTQELRDMAAAMALVTDISNVQNVEQLYAAFDALGRRSQELVDTLTDTAAAMRFEGAERSLDAQIAGQRVLVDLHGEQTEEARIAVQMAELLAQLDERDAEALRGKVTTYQQLVSQAQREATARQLTSEREVTQERMRALTNPADIISRQFGGGETVETRVRMREIQMRSEGRGAEFEANRDAIEQNERLMAQYELMGSLQESLSSSAAELGKTLLFEGADEAGQRLLEMLIDMQFQLAANLLVAGALRAALGGFGAESSYGAGTPFLSGGGQGTVTPIARQEGGPLAAGQVATVAEAGPEAFVADAVAAATAPTAAQLAATTGLPEADVARIGRTRGGQALLGMVAEHVEPSGAAVQMLGTSGGPELFRAPVSGTVISAPDLRMITAAIGRHGAKRSGPLAPGERAVVGEVGLELLAPGRIGRALRANRLADLAPVLRRGLGGDELPRMLGRRGPETIVASRDAEVVSNRDLARLSAHPVGAELIRIAMQAPPVVQRNPDTTREIRHLAAGTMSVGASAPAQGAPAGNNVSFQIIDQRPAGSPEIQTTRHTGADGRTMITAIVKGGLAEMHRDGSLQSLLSKGYGISPRPRS